MKNNDIKPIMKLKKIGYGLDTGITPSIAIYYQQLLELPIVSFANVGVLPKNNSLNKLTSKIKKLCGYEWDNKIERLYFYSGAKITCPFHIQLYFEKVCRTSSGKLFGKSAYKYEFTLYDILGTNTILSFQENLHSWNSKISKGNMILIGETLKKYEDKLSRNISSYK